MDATVAAQLTIALNFIALIVLSVFFIAPWARTRSLRDALIPLVAIHLGRTVALQLWAQAGSIGMSDGLRDQIIWGDQLGFAVALVAIVLLAMRSELAKPAAWVLVVVTALDLGNALVGGISENLLGQTTDVSWLILTFYVPVLWVSIGLIAWLLVVRRGEAIRAA